MLGVAIIALMFYLSLYDTIYNSETNICILDTGNSPVKLYDGELFIKHSCSLGYTCLSSWLHSNKVKRIVFRESWVKCDLPKYSSRDYNEKVKLQFITNENFDKKIQTFMCRWTNECISIINEFRSKFEIEMIIIDKI